MVKNQKKRKGLTFRCQSNPNDPLTKVLEWLHSLESRDRRDKIERMLLSLLPYALNNDQQTKEEVERCYWDVHLRLQDYLFVMRHTLDINVPISPGLHPEINISTDFSKQSVASEDKDQTEEIETEEDHTEEVDFSKFDSVF